MPSPGQSWVRLMKEDGRMETKSLIPSPKSPSPKPQCSKKGSNDQMPNALFSEEFGTGQLKNPLSPFPCLIPAWGFFRHYGRKAPWGHAPLRGLGISHSTERHGLVIPVSGSSECGRTFYHWHRCCSLPTSFRPNPSFPCILEDCSIPRTGRAKASTGPSRAMRSSPAIE